MAGRRRKARVRSADHRLIATTIALAVVVLVCGAAGAALSAALSSVAHELPSLDVTEHQPIYENTYIYDGSKKPRLLAVLRANESRVIVASDQISPLAKEAAVAIEDERFYQHEGVDYVAIGRALLADVQAGETVQGGSTITQQFIKNVYTPPDEKGQRTFSRKLREAVLAYQLERLWPKDKILTNYLNTVYFGQGAYGIEMAARTFFGTNARRLTLPQAALLAGMIRHPSEDNPFVDAQAARRRRQLVLDRMVELGFVTSPEAAVAAAAPLPTQPHGLPKSHVAPYFVEYVIQELVREFGPEEAFGGGLRVYTTLDRRMQRDANWASRAILNRRGDPTVAIVAVDPRSGEVKAMVGGRDFKRQQFNVAVQSHRQPGSAFKIFALVAALQQYMSPQSVFYSEPKVIDMGENADPWVVSTYSLTYAGRITLFDATVYSDNTVFADVSMMVGPENISAAAHNMGINSAVGTNPAIALGGLNQGVSPLEMAAAYATVASGGERVSGSMFDQDGSVPISIRTVEDARGNVLYRNNLVRQRVLLKWEAGLVTTILQAAIQRGTGTAAYLGRPCAGKTGTTSDYDDAWFCGYTPDLVATVWVGYVAKQRPLYVHGIHVAGGTFPAQIWRAFMTRALAGTPAHGFPAYQTPPVQKAIVCATTGDLATRWCPERIKAFYYNGHRPQDTCALHRPKEVAMPRVAGLQLSTAERILHHAKLDWTVAFVTGPASQTNVVMRQEPRVGDMVLQGTKVTLDVGCGPLQVVPGVVGLCREEAERLLAGSGFRADETFTGSPGDQGFVTGQNPQGGSTAQGAVQIQIGGGDVGVTVPNVSGMSADAARSTLSGYGLGTTTTGATGQGSRVAGQIPHAGAKVRIGALVTLTME